MLEALSLRLGGDLISAEKCDYNSFCDLALLCPSCRESVYLTAASKKSAYKRKNKNGEFTEVKASTIQTHFKHHPNSKNFNASECALRLEQMNAEQRAVFARIARNQRSAYLRSHLWAIVQTSAYMVDHEKFIEVFNDCFLNDKSFKLNIRVKEKIVNSVLTSARRAEHTFGLEEAIEVLFEQCALDLQSDIWQKTPADRSVAANLLNLINSPKQAQIVYEAYLYLIQPRQTGILTAMIESILCREVGTLSPVRDESDKRAYVSNTAAHVGYSFSGLKLDTPIIKEFFGRLALSSDIITKEFADTAVSCLIYALMAIDWGTEFEKLKKKKSYV